MIAQFLESLERRRLFSGTPVGGAGPVGPNPIRAGLHQQDRLRDGARQIATTATAVSATADTVRDHTQQRLRDGSCKA